MLEALMTTTIIINLIVIFIVLAILVIALIQYIRDRINGIRKDRIRKEMEDRYISALESYIRRNMHRKGDENESKRT